MLDRPGLGHAARPDSSRGCTNWWRCMELTCENTMRAQCSQCWSAICGLPASSKARGKGREHGAECPNRHAGLSDRGTAGQDLQKAMHNLRGLPLPLVALSIHVYGPAQQRCPWVDAHELMHQELSNACWAAVRAANAPCGQSLTASSIVQARFTSLAGAKAACISLPELPCDSASICRPRLLIHARSLQPPLQSSTQQTHVCTIHRKLQDSQQGAAC